MKIRKIKNQIARLKKKEINPIMTLTTTVTTTKIIIIKVIIIIRKIEKTIMKAAVLIFQCKLINHIKCDNKLYVCFILCNLHLYMVYIIYLLFIVC